MVSVMRSAISRALLLTALLPLASAPATAQQIAIDRGIRAGGLWCFPLASDPRTFVYLPSSVRLSQDDAGRPQFSFVRYVAEAADDPAKAATITASGGGGVLHFLVEMDTPSGAIAEAQQIIRSRLKDDDVTLRGPVVFQEGRYALVSSILNPAGGAPERKILTSGRAPVLEGNRLAFAFDLTPQQSTLLMATFGTAAPDVSLVFDMTFAGLTEAYDAELTIDWAEVRTNKAFSAGGSAYYVGADVELAFDRLRRDNAIKLRSSGDNAAMEALLTTVYTKLLDLLFRPVEPERVPEGQQGGLADAISAILDPSGPLGSRKTTGFGLNVAYQLKDLKSSGLSVLNFNHRSSVERHSVIAFNIGDFHRKYGSDTKHFRAINIDDPTFQQRVVHVALDGALAPDFDRYINSVSVTLRKQHQNGQETVRELVLDRQAAAKLPAALAMVYGWNGDDDRTAWLQYEYRTRWSFKGGGMHETAWTRSATPVIDLFAPYERQTVQILGRVDALKQKQVRAVVVEIAYEFFGQRRQHQLVIRADKPAEDHALQLTVPLGNFRYDYNITWQLEGGQRLTSTGRDSSGVVIVDELPTGSGS
jgi:hypothetical protein